MPKAIVAQIFGIIGLVTIVLSFQCKKNSLFFLMQGVGSFMFFLNFILIGAYGGAFFNILLYHFALSLILHHYAVKFFCFLFTLLFNSKQANRQCGFKKSYSDHHLPYAGILRSLSDFLS